jgi:hypothetical protein
LLLVEANVDPDQLTKYFGDSGGSANRLHMLFDFLLNAQIMLALARQDPEPVIDALRDTPALPDWSQWATFLRNHDEVDLSRLTADQRQEVFAAFGPQEDMRLYGRGIRRRLAPMLGGDQRRIRLAYSLQFTLRGTPVIRYGKEIGMGDDLSLLDRLFTGMLDRHPHSAWIHRLNAECGGYRLSPPRRVLGVFSLPLTVLRRVRVLGRGSGGGVPCGVGVADLFGAGQAAIGGGPQASVHRFGQACSRWWPAGRWRTRWPWRAVRAGMVTRSRRCGPSRAGCRRGSRQRAAGYGPWPR